MVNVRFKKSREMLIDNEMYEILFSYVIFSIYIEGL